MTCPAHLEKRVDAGNAGTPQDLCQESYPVNMKHIAEAVHVKLVE